MGAASLRRASCVGNGVGRFGSEPGAGHLRTTNRAPRPVAGKPYPPPIMLVGPVLLFDKSMLESLNQDEAVFLDRFFLSNIAPVFLLETRADLVKVTRVGRTAESVVGSLAHKTPDMEAYPNVHHLTLLQGELLGLRRVPLSAGMPIIASHAPVTLGDESAVFVPDSPEAAALRRWQSLEFEGLEREVARLWRGHLDGIDIEAACDPYRALVHRWKPKSLAEVRSRTYGHIEMQGPRALLEFGMDRFRVDEESRAECLRRHRAEGQPGLDTFAPYLRYLLEVDALFGAAVAASLVSPDRPSNAVDVLYLYYLPFCNVFTSNDRLHERLAPLLMRSNQTFVRGQELKGDLARIAAHYSAMPQERLDEGLLRIATRPPFEQESVVADLWSKYATNWSGRGAPGPCREDDTPAGWLRRIREIEDLVQRGDFARLDDEADIMVIRRLVRPRKGKWLRFKVRRP